MEPYNKNILIIDDRINELEGELITPLKNLGYSIEPQSNPYSGKKIASHNYSIIFIDYHYTDYPDTNGIILSQEISEQCPLSTLILITAYDNYMHMEEFIRGAWDGGFIKNRHTPSELEKDLVDCISNALRNKYQNSVWKRIHEIHNHPKKNDFEQELNCIEEILAEDSRNNTVEWIAISLNRKKSKDRLKEAHGINNEEEVKEILSYYEKINDQSEKKIKPEKIISETLRIWRAKKGAGESLKFTDHNCIANILIDLYNNVNMNRVILNQRFQKKSNGNFTDYCLLMRHLMIENPTKWALTREELKPLRELITYFGI